MSNQISIVIFYTLRNVKALEAKLEKAHNSIDKLKREREKSEAAILEMSVELDDLRSERTELMEESDKKVSQKEVEMEKKRYASKTLIIK